MCTPVSVKTQQSTDTFKTITTPDSLNEYKTIVVADKKGFNVILGRESTTTNELRRLEFLNKEQNDIQDIQDTMAMEMAQLDAIEDYI